MVTTQLREEITNKANIVLIGETIILEEGTKICGKSQDLNYVGKFERISVEEGNKFFLDIKKGKNHTYNLSECSKESGESVLEALNLALDLAKQNKIDAINFGPFNKTSMQMGGNTHSDELHLMAEKLDHLKYLFFLQHSIIESASLNNL